MSIQWYPGHMAKAKRQFQEKIKLVDIVYELVDARIPLSSRNPEIDAIVQDKPRIIILMKKDLADDRQSQKWLNHFHQEKIPALLFDANQSGEVKKVQQLTREILAGTFEKLEDKGIKKRPIRAVIAGIPNVGKSTFINRMAGKKVTQIGNKPGVTRAQQWIRSGQGIELLDTPGILWPKFQDQEAAIRLALTGAITDRILYLDDIALYALEFLRDHYPGAIADRYPISKEAEAELDLPDLLMEITAKRGFQTDYERGSEMIVNEIRKGIVGQFTFDWLEEYELDHD